LLWEQISDKKRCELFEFGSTIIVFVVGITGFNFILENIMKIVQKFGILACAILLSAGVVGVSQAADTTMPPIKVAIVNVQQVLQQSPRVVSLSKQLESQFKDRQTKIGDEQKALQDELDNFKKESPTMSQTNRDAMQKKIAGDRAELVKKVVAYQQDLQKEQNKIMQGILGDLNGIVSTIAKKQAYALVLDSQAVIFAADGNDITKDVAKQFNDKK
jgi:outer membrane protein